MGQGPVSALGKHTREPPQLAQAGIFHPPHEHRVQQSGVRSQESEVGVLPTAHCSTPTRCIGPRPFASASGRWPQELVYMGLLPVSSIK
jgi:hypothetical protein